MKTELLGQEKNVVTIKLDIEASEFTKALNKALNELSQQVNMPGFRKGKTPRKILEMRFGKEALYHEALDKIVPDQIKQIIDDYDLEPLEAPTLDIKEKIEEGKNVICDLIFEVKPEIELPEVENFEIEKLIAEVKEEDVDKFAKQVQFQLAEVKSVERPVKDEDLVDVELTVKTLNPDGSEATEQPRPEPTHEKIDLTDQTLRKEVREALIGKSKGEEAFTTFDVEENHQEKILAGKKVSYKMKIENVSEYVLPEINEDFLKKAFGDNTEIKDVEAFRARLRADLERETADEVLNDVRGRATRLIIDNSKLEVPEKLIQRQIESNRKADEEWAKNNQVNLSDAYGLNTEEGKKGYENILRNRAEGSLKDVFVMDELAKKYDVHVEKEDLEKEFERRAKAINVSKGFIAKYFYEHENDLDRLTDSVRWDKIADTVISHMKVKEVYELSKPEQNEQKPEENQNQGE
mgnify:CR=1 FL=1